MPPWQRGQAAANALRQTLGLGAQPLDDQSLADLLQIEATRLITPPEAVSPPIGLAVRNSSDTEWKLLFRKWNRPARRFEAARFIADYVFSEPDDRWLPITDTATARQKQQRAFAAEFLCPIESLRKYLGDQFSPEALDDAAHHFGVSELAVRSQLEKHDLIPARLLHATLS